MLIIKGHKIQLLPNNIQCVTFRRWAGTARWIYNWGLEYKIKAYQETGRSPRGYALSKQITALKRTEEYAWLQDISYSVPRMALRHLDQAYQNFFRRVKQGITKKGFPKYKSRKRSKMVFHLESSHIQINNKRVRLPKIGWVRMTKPLRFKGRLVGAVAVSERAGKWYISLNVETEHVPTKNQGGAVGIDLGIKTLATLSDGIAFKNPKALRRYRRLLARAQRQMTRRQQGSNRWQKAKLRVQRIQKRIADIRVDATHKATHYITDNYDFVAMETLNVQGMMQNHHLAGAVADANFFEFQRQMNYKLAWNERIFAKVGMWFPSSKTCSECGCINDSLILADRTWTCNDCEAVHNRDRNAATNILVKALQMLQIPDGLDGTGCGGSGAVRPPCEASREILSSVK